MVPLLYSEAPWWLSLSLRGKPPPFQRPSRSYTTWALANFLPPASASLPHSSTAATHRPTSCQCYLCAPSVLIRRVLALTAPSLPGKLSLHTSTQLTPLPSRVCSVPPSQGVTTSPNQLQPTPTFQNPYHPCFAPLPHSTHHPTHCITNLLVLFISYLPLLRGSTPWGQQLLVYFVYW